MKYVIIGGTGTLGQEILRQLIEKDALENGGEIVIFSRCEHKQKALRSKYPQKNLKFTIGSIQDVFSLNETMKKADVVFHVAALKHIDTMEENPVECIKTNLNGTINSGELANISGVKKFVFFSTDKAVDPINVYGMCKSISERILLNWNKGNNDNRFIIYRWGNVLGSTGSFLHTIHESVKNDLPIPITSWQMSRYFIDIQDAVKFMLDTYMDANGAYVQIPPMKACFIEALIMAYSRVFEKHLAFIRTEVVGLRLGEKMHERISSIHNLNNCSNGDSMMAEHYNEEELFHLVKRASRKNGWI